MQKLGISNAFSPPGSDFLGLAGRTVDVCGGWWLSMSVGGNPRDFLWCGGWGGGGWGEPQKTKVSHMEVLDDLNS